MCQEEAMSGLGKTRLLCMVIFLYASTTGLSAGTFGGGSVIQGLSAFDCGSITGVPPVECQALVSLYESTNGLAWAQNDGWLTTTTPCSWFGVTCEEGQVRELNLAGNGLSGSIPPELANLSGLQVLYLGVPRAIQIAPYDQPISSAPYHPASRGNFSMMSNQLTGTIPPELGNLTALRILGLSGNQLSGYIPPELGNLTGIQSLYLDGNALTGAVPPELGNLSTLKDLLLGDNDLSGSLPAELGNLVSLEILDVEHNQLSGFIPYELGDLTSLHYLVLHGNQFSGGIPSWLGNLANLELLVLSENQLSGAIPPELGKLAGLRYFYLNDNPLKGGLPRSLLNLHLDWFWFDNTGVCAPQDATFIAWLAGIGSLRESGSVCLSYYLPFVDRQNGEIYGTVSLGGVPIEGVGIKIWEHCLDRADFWWTNRGYVLTDAAGTYRFLNMSSVPYSYDAFGGSCGSYAVTYQNPTPGNGRIAYYQTQELSPYNYGSVVHLEDFDIAEVPLQSPGSGFNRDWAGR
jgi:hypothetical protein